MKSDSVAAVRWFDVGQALLWALEAYQAASRAMEVPEGEDAEGWASKGDFAHEFHAGFTRRLSLAAFRHGNVPDPGSATEVLGWPVGGDSAEQTEFLERLKKCGLCVGENAADNRASAGVR